MTVEPDVERVLHDFKNSNKAIALSCIAPVLASKVFGDVELTLGCSAENWPYAGSIEAAKSWGSTMYEKDIHEVCIDSKNNIVTVPAYMKGDALPHEVADNMEQLVKEVSVFIEHGSWTSQ